jgi:hypothetical protein
MTAVEVTNSVKEITPNAGLKIVQVWTAIASNTNVTKVTLADYGIKTLYNVITQAHDTENSILVTEAATTAVSAGVLTVTFGSASDTKKRSILIVGA